MGREVRLGIDVACTAAHQASLADETGEFLWQGWRFKTTTADLEALWSKVPDGVAVVVIMEPTRNAWVPLAAWLQARGAKVSVVPPEQSADLRDYYNKHTKTDRLDSKMLARMPMLHPEGLRSIDSLGPADPFKRAVRQRASVQKRRVAAAMRLDAMLELLGPGWAELFGAVSYGKTAVAVLERYANPHALKKLGRSRLTKVLIRASRGHWREDKADEILAAADETLGLWSAGGLDFDELADDIAVEVRLIKTLDAEMASLDDRIAALYEQADPAGIVVSAPGIGVTLAAGIWAAPVTSTGSRAWPVSGPSPASSPRSTSPASLTITRGRPRPVTRACARRCSSPPTWPARSTRLWRRATTASTSRPASTTTRPSAPSPPRSPPASQPAGATGSAMSFATRTDDPSPRPKVEPSALSATRSIPPPEPAAAMALRHRQSRGRAGARRSRPRPLRRPARPSRNLSRKSPEGLDTR